MLRLNGFMRVDDSHYDVVRTVEEEVLAVGLKIRAQAEREAPAEVENSNP